VTTVEDARRLAAQHLAVQLPQRWHHVQAVAATAARLAAALDELDSPPLVCSAWLHDIGYAADVAETGFHALDGARYLRGRGIDDRVACLVAHHSCAAVEADERGLSRDLAEEFPREESPTADALLFADMTTGPDGSRISVEDRIREIRDRYGKDDVVTAFVERAEDEIVAAVRRTEARLRLVRAGR